MLDYDQYQDETVSYSCRRCQRRILSLDEHEEQCERETDLSKRRKAIRRLERHTAEMLRRKGFHSRADVHEGRG